MRKYFFENISDLIGHLKAIDSDMGPIRLQKTLYFLYAFYGATYGSISVGQSEDGENFLSELDNEQTYPPELFDAKFEAWQYGPVIRSVYFANRNGSLDFLPDINQNGWSRDDKEVVKFVDSLVEDLKEMSDFALVDRTHQDESWKSKFDPQNPYLSPDIDNKELIKEYKNKLAEASKI